MASRPPGKDPAARSAPDRPKRRGAQYVIRFAGHAGLAALFITVALLGVLSGVMFAYAGDLPQITALDNYAPSAITRVYASNGETLAEFLDSWLEDVAATAKSRNTVTAYRLDVRRWQATAGDLKLQRVTAADIERTITVWRALAVEWTAAGPGGDA